MGVLKSLKKIIVLLLASFFLLDLLGSCYNFIFPKAKKDKVKSLLTIGDEIQKYNSDIDISLEMYAIDCELGREKISYTTNIDVSEIRLKTDYDNYICYIINYNNKTYINVEKNTWLNRYYPFFDFFLYTRFGKSFGIYIKMISFYLASIGLLFVVYKPYIEYNKNKMIGK